MKRNSLFKNVTYTFLVLTLSAAVGSAFGADKKDEGDKDKKITEQKVVIMSTTQTQESDDSANTSQQSVTGVVRSARESDDDHHHRIRRISKDEKKVLEDVVSTGTSRFKHEDEKENEDRHHGEQHQVVITNTSVRTITSFNISFTGKDSGDFSQSNDCGQNLESGEHCKITVTFNPSSPGPKEASMEIETSEGSQSVALTSPPLWP